MLARPVVMTGMLGAAVGVPYAIHNPPDEWPAWPTQQAAPVAEQSIEAAGAPAPAVKSLPSVQGPQFPNSLVYESPMPLEGGGFYSIEQVLRMDITKDWVYQHWARKSTGLSEPDLFGIRVPLVTGTGMADLAGSLSYYFNGQGQVDKLRFRGVTADTSRLVALAQQQYGLTWQPPRVPGEQLLQSRAGDKVVSQLRTFPEPVLWSTKPHGSFGVDLEFNRPGSNRFVDSLGPRLQVPEATAQAPPPAPEPQQASASPGAPAGASGPQLQNAQRPDFRWPN
ncbi:hypothetical protein Pla123a_27700 [Posidoniimonas polymericola]|uniref:DUF6690 domain-containing protein n=1 Tax=Posidoniimonas polymericola TaxID=2528002 RepID=A0A5C5YM42_9BACT|nr:DUF6690 family protein [Posidoniimonas polymericola]TWT75984.1 hypothetical protein Pla123a_27700 [Posidoniimonas polymericola]